MLSHVWLFCEPLDCSPPGSSVRGILQARIVEWAAIPFSRGSSWSRDRICLSCLLHWQVGSLPSGSPGKPVVSGWFKRITCMCTLFLLLLHQLQLRHQILEVGDPCSQVFREKSFLASSQLLGTPGHPWGALACSCITPASCLRLHVTFFCVPPLGLSIQITLYFFFGIKSLDVRTTLIKDEKWKYQSLSRVWLFVTPWSIAHWAPLSTGFSRQEYWSGLPFLSPGDLPDPGIKPVSPALQADSWPLSHLGSIPTSASILTWPSVFLLWVRVFRSLSTYFFCNKDTSH